MNTELNPLRTKIDYIHNLLDTLRNESEVLGIAYDKTSERNFARHILTSKDFGEFCEKIQQDRETFSINIMRASKMIEYRK